MKQLINQKGNIVVEEVPPPAHTDNEVLVRTHISLISTGTELSGLSAAKESLLTRAFKQPHNVKKAMTMAADKGFLKTYKVIKGMLDFGVPVGYSSAGQVLAVGKNVSDIKVGDFVTCSGAGAANHAEVVAVPRPLVCKIPDGLDLHSAASVTLGAIAMQGVRQANLRLGESVAVIGLGLIGQLTAQILNASGCRVIGIDPDSSRREVAQKLGAAHVLAPNEAHQIKNLTNGFGVDATIITASTDSHEPVRQAMEITRKKGTVVVVGAVGLNLTRSPWYEKEIDLKISCSYGPGRYDPSYEEEMLDYPYAYVRWTENRNMEAYVKLLADGKVKFMALEPEQYPVQEAARAYRRLQEAHPLALLLTYDVTQPVEKKITVIAKKSPHHSGRVRIALIGAGSFATITHLPNLAKLSRDFELKAIVSKKGTTAKQFASQYKAEYCTTDAEEVFKDPEIDAVLIATRHNVHADLALRALEAGKAVFVEKPLALKQEELTKIIDFFKTQSGTLHPLPSPLLTVGFNRRFSPYFTRLKELTAARKNPLLVTYRVNAGYLPPEHWTQGSQGGGRIIGEACHFFDVFEFLTGGKPVKIEAAAISPKTKDILAQDNFSATITYSDGSVCNLLYTALGHRDLPKEYMEVFCDGRVYALDDYKALRAWGGPGSMKTFTQNKGHWEELRTFAEAFNKGEFPIPLEDIFSVTKTSFEVAEKITHS